MVLIKVWHKIEFSDWSAVFVALLECVKVVSRVSVFVDRAFLVSCIELPKRTLEIFKFLSNELLEIISEEPEQLILLVQLLHILCELLEIASNRGRIDSS